MRRNLCVGLVLLLLCISKCTSTAAETDFLLTDFEHERAAKEWTFSNGPEFPGAMGKFERADEGAHGGRFCGKLAFDFKGGGNYVAAIVQVPEHAGANPGLNALRVWLMRPEGNEVQLRYTDSTDQTFQKPVECAADRWVEVIIPFEGWTGYWGGVNNGKPRGRLKSLALLIAQGGRENGALLLDDLRLTHHEAVVKRVSYPAYRFDSNEGWRMRTEGNGGSSKLEGKRWVLDFAQGAPAISLTVPDHVLLGNVDRLRLKLRGGHAGLTVALSLRTHFMTFHKIIGALNGEGEQELATDGPPGPGWEWHGGENDGKIHGPLRLAEIRVVSNGQPVKCELQLDELVVDASCPAEKQCVLLAESRGLSRPEEFNVTVRALSDTALEGQLKWIFRDWDGRELETGTRPLSVRQKCAVTEIKLPVPDAMVRGKKFLEADISLDVPGQETAPVRAAWVAPLEVAGDATMMPESPFGMGVYLNRYGGDTSGLALMDRAAQMARDAGVKWSREDFSWSRIQPRRGEYDWQYYDQLVACAKRNGITVYGIACYWSGWTKPYTSEGIADYVEFVKALVKRYQKDIRNWEIWNEPNIFFWQGPRDMYAELLAKSYAAIKEIDPGIQVLGLSTAGIDKAFIARMLELKAPFDVLTIHPYRKQLNDRAFINDLKNVSGQVKLPDGRSRPVWLTEMGWATHTPHNTVQQDFAANSLRTQAQLIARSYLCAIVSGVDPRTFWYNFRNDGNDPIYFEHQMGIVYNDFRPKPAYVSYATLTKVLRGKVLDRQLEAGKEVLAYRFKPVSDGQGEVIAAWNPMSDGRVELPVAGSRVVRVNAMGETEPAEIKQGKVVITLRKGAVEYLLGK